LLCIFRILFKSDLEIKPLNKETSQQNKNPSHGKYLGITTANVITDDVIAGDAVLQCSDFGAEGYSLSGDTL